MWFVGQGRFRVREGYAPSVRLAPRVLGQVQVEVPLAHGRITRGAAPAFKLVLHCPPSLTPTRRTQVDRGCQVHRSECTGWDSFMKGEGLGRTWNYEVQSTRRDTEASHLDEDSEQLNRAATSRRQCADQPDQHRSSSVFTCTCRWGWTVGTWIPGWHI